MIRNQRLECDCYFGSVFWIKVDAGLTKYLWHGPAVGTSNGKT